MISLTPSVFILLLQIFLRLYVMSVLKETEGSFSLDSQVWFTIAASNVK